MDMITVKSTLGGDIIGDVLVCWGYLIEVTSIYDNIIYGRPFLDENAESLPPDTHSLKLKTLLEFGFSVYPIEEARQIFKEFLIRNTP